MHFPSSPWVAKRWGRCFLFWVGSLIRQRVGSVREALCSYRCAGRLKSPAPTCRTSIYGAGANLRPAPAPPDSSRPPWPVHPAQGRCRLYLC